ncbi:hypothetical protein A0H81_10932 [Grifola frondosa]|uniref:DUF6532 domain-containing protein n=1 Tax=Grifola frondosa TaxID=5627 RepID=A0A1C7LYP5_GRIFR|nr:hypothetical protein A0H81_10932 [Grifola frondosa]
MARTRRTNADKHPGVPDQKGKHRTKAEMAKDRAEKAAAEAEKASKTKKKQVHIAALEDDIVATDVQTESERVTKASKKGLKRTYAQRNVLDPPSVENGGDPLDVAKASENTKSKQAPKVIEVNSDTEEDDADPAGASDDSESEELNESKKGPEAAHVGRSGVKNDWAESTQAPGWTSVTSDSTQTASAKTKPAVTKMVAKPPATPKPAAKKSPGKIQAKGFVSDSDEDVEHVAAQSSPAKPPGTRITSNGMVKTVDLEKQVVMKPSKQRQSKVSIIKTETVDSNASSDDEDEEQDRKGYLFVERLAVTREQGLKVLRLVWDMVIGSQYPAPVDFDDLAASVTQRLSEWRCAFGQGAIVQYEAYFKGIKEYADDPVARAKHASDLLIGGLFTYEVQDTKAIKGLFRAPILLNTFSHHYSAIEGAVHVPGLYPNNLPPRPNGALALAITAVERALKLFSAQHVVFGPGKPKIIEVFNDKTGNTSSTPNQFSGDKWAKITQQWITSVSALSDAKMQVIIEKARQDPAAASTSRRASDGEDYDRAHMFDPDSD